MSFVTHNDDGGAASSMGDFVRNKLGPFMENHALWVADQSPASLTLPEDELFTHAGTVGTPAPPFVFIRCSGSQLLIGHGTGIDTAQEWFDQPGNPGNSPLSLTYSGYEPPFSTAHTRGQHMMLFTGVTGALSGHYLFTDGDGDTIPGTYVHAAIQVQTNLWRHLWFGTMKKFGTFTGGQYTCSEMQRAENTYIDAPYSSEHIYPHSNMPFNAVGSVNVSENGVLRSNVFRAEGLRSGITWWVTNGRDSEGQFGPIDKGFGTINDNTESVGNGAIVGGGNTVGSTLFFCEPNLSAKSRPLIPLIFMVKYNFESAERWGPIGQIPDVFRANIRGFSPNESFVIGADTYRIYPLVNHLSSVGANNPYSGYEGIVYKEVPAA
jgi:hypothetical protein